jgi:hypothetical protein
MTVAPGGAGVEKSTISPANPYRGGAIRARSSAAITGREHPLKHRDERIKTDVCFTVTHPSFAEIADE